MTAIYGRINMIPKGQSDADTVTGTVLQTLYTAGYGGQLALHLQDSALCHPDKVLVLIN
jgi:hypothetical protein